MDFREALRKVIEDTIAENTVAGMTLDQIADLARQCDHDDLDVIDDPELVDAYRMVLDATPEQVEATLPTLDSISLPDPPITPQEEVARFSGQLDLTDDPTSAELNRLHAIGGIHAILDTIDDEGGFTTGPHALPAADANAEQTQAGIGDTRGPADDSTAADVGEVEESMRRTDTALRACDAALHQLDQATAEQEHTERLARWHTDDQATADERGDTDTDDTSAERDLS